MSILKVMQEMVGTEPLHQQSFPYPKQCFASFSDQIETFVVILPLHPSRFCFAMPCKTWLKSIVRNALSGAPQIQCPSKQKKKSFRHCLACSSVEKPGSVSDYAFSGSYFFLLLIRFSYQITALSPLSSATF